MTNHHDARGAKMIIIFHNEGRWGTMFQQRFWLTQNNSGRFGMVDTRCPALLHGDITADIGAIVAVLCRGEPAPFSHEGWSYD